MAEVTGENPIVGIEPEEWELLAKMLLWKFTQFALYDIAIPHSAMIDEPWNELTISRHDDHEIGVLIFKISTSG